MHLILDRERPIDFYGYANHSTSTMIIVAVIMISIFSPRFIFCKDIDVTSLWERTNYQSSILLANEVNHI